MKVLVNLGPSTPEKEVSYMQRQAVPTPVKQRAVDTILELQNYL